MRILKRSVCLILLVSCIVAGGYKISTFFMEDRTPPVISFEEKNITVSVKDNKELLKGVSAEDKKDGDLTSSVRVSNMSHFITPGKRNVEYVVFDKAGNAATAQRVVTYSDYTPPRIHLSKPLRYTEKEFDSISLFGNMSVEDSISGDLDNQITISSVAYKNDPSLGIRSYTIQAEVSNSAGDICSVPLEVVVTDSTDSHEDSKYYPMLKEYILYTKVGETLDLKANVIGAVHNGVEYTFEKDNMFLGFSRGSIRIKDNIDYSKPGHYTVEYSYRNPYGVTAVTKLVVIVEEA